jgi:hypothetical protein
MGPQLQEQQNDPAALFRNFPRGMVYQCIQECDFSKLPRAVNPPKHVLRLGTKGKVTDVSPDS